MHRIDIVSEYERSSGAPRVIYIRVPSVRHLKKYIHVRGRLRQNLLFTRAGIRRKESTRRKSGLMKSLCSLPYSPLRW